MWQPNQDWLHTLISFCSQRVGECFAWMKWMSETFTCDCQVDDMTGKTLFPRKRLNEKHQWNIRLWRDKCENGQLSCVLSFLTNETYNHLRSYRGLLSSGEGCCSPKRTQPSHLSNCHDMQTQCSWNTFCFTCDMQFDHHVSNFAALQHTNKWVHEKTVHSRQRCLCTFVCTKVGQNVTYTMVRNTAGRYTNKPAIWHSPILQILLQAKELKLACQILLTAQPLNFSKCKHNMVCKKERERQRDWCERERETGVWESHCAYVFVFAHVSLTSKLGTPSVRMLKATLNDTLGECTLMQCLLCCCCGWSTSSFWCCCCCSQCSRFSF